MSKMLMKSAVALVVAGGLATPVLAANATSVKDQSPATNADQNTNAKQTSVRQRLTDDLTKAGFTDVKIMPESFLVRAKDSKGDPIMMVINPDSFTAVTEVTEPKSASEKMSGANPNGKKVLSGADANGDPTPPAKQ